MGETSRFLTLFAALLAASFGVRSASSRLQAGSASTTRHGNLTSESDGPKSILATFTDFDKNTAYADPYDAAGTCSAARPNAGASEMQWAIATVPDPARSNLKLDFDREVEAIQNAAASAGYQFERFWFPWHPVSAATTESADEAPATGEPQPRSDAVPGVLLFHRSAADETHGSGLAIFLVGETPTSGINPGQFRYALCLGSSLNEPPAQRSVLRIMGPVYSASFDSLAKLAGDARRDLKVRSWTTDLESQRIFETRTHADLQTTRTPSIISINSFVRFLRSDWHESGPIVLLKEEGTALAAGIKGRSDCEPQPAGADELLLEDCKVRLLEFPRNLSTLRNASEAEAVASVAPGGNSEIPRTGLTLSLKGDTASFEIPIFSQAQTPVSQESVLFSISNLLKTGTVHYAGVIASDPLDVLYLSRYLRSSCPNLRLFLLDPDLLIEHGSDSSDFDGILSVTTYPLFPLTQVWEKSGDALQIFPSEHYEAVYNAVLSSLWEPGAPVPHYVDLRNPFDLPRDAKSHLPLWLTVAGRNGFEPIAILPAAAESFTIEPTIGQTRLFPEYWDNWGYSFTILLAACLLFSCAIGGAAAGGGKTAAVFAVKPQEQGAPARALYLTAIGACLSALALVWLAVPGEIVLLNLPGERHLFTGKWFAFGLFWLGVLAAVSAFAATAHRRRGEPASSSHWRFRHLLFPRTPAPLTGFSCSTAVLALSLIFAFPEPFKNQNSYVLQQLWHLLLMGSFALGVTVVATACPAWDLLRAHVPFVQASGPRLTRLESRRIWIPAIGAMSIAGFAFLASLAAFSLFVMRGPSTAFGSFFLACRSLNLTSGVSPLVPLTLLLLVMLSLASVHLRRIVYYEDHCPTVPYLRKGLFCPRLRFTVAETRRRTSRLAFHPAYGAALLALAFVVWRIWNTHTHDTLETPAVEELLVYASVIAGFFLLLVWIRVLLIWNSFGEFLQQLERHPLRNVFSLLPKGFVWSPVWQGGGKKRTHVAITRSLECILALHNHNGTPAWLRATINSRLADIKRQVREVLQVSASRRRIPRPLFRELERNLAEVSAAAADYLESKKWTSGDYELKNELSSRPDTKDALQVPQYRYHDDEPATICGELVAFRFLAFINYVLGQLDNLVGFLSFGFLLLVVAMNSYEFRSRTIIGWVLVLMFIALTSGIMTVLAQAARDAILSRITGTKEGKLDRNFVVHLISYGALPVLVLAATHFPSVGRFFFSWVKPALEAIH